MQENINIPDSTITTNLSFRNLVLMNMQQLTNFPYIEKDFDALTDYELLCLVVKYLNDVIANQNEQNDSITRMYESFLALQTYVNNTKDTLEDAFNDLDDYVRNYFDNLDVQDEINNKLDDMAESGQLTDIIAQYLGLAGMITFDTVADMKTATNLVNGSKCRTFGYHSVNDGGSATYKIRQVTNDDVVDEANIIEVYDNLLVAELIYDCEVCAEQFGAYGDGVHDDKLAIQKMFDSNNKNMIMNKTYLISDSITLKGDNKKLHGTGSINCTHATNPALILNVWYSEINLVGSITAHECIYFRATETDDHFIQYVLIKNVNLDATDKCVKCERITGKWINELKFEDVSFKGEYGVYFMGDFSNAGYRFVNCGNETCNTAFIRAYNMSDIDIIGLRNAESFNKDLLYIDNTCSFFNINTSDPICLGKIKLNKTIVTKGTVTGNIQNDGQSRIGSRAVCWNGVFKLNPSNPECYQLSVTNDTFDYTVNSLANHTNVLPDNYRIPYVDGGHTYTITIPKAIKDYNHHLFNIVTFSGVSTITLHCGNDTFTIAFNGSGNYSIDNINGVLYATKLDATQLT